MTKNSNIKSKKFRLPPPGAETALAHPKTQFNTRLMNINSICNDSKFEPKVKHVLGVSVLRQPQPIQKTHFRIRLMNRNSTCNDSKFKYKIKKKKLALTLVVITVEIYQVSTHVPYHYVEISYQKSNLYWLSWSLYQVSRCQDNLSLSKIHFRTRHTSINKTQNV